MFAFSAAISLLAIGLTHAKPKLGTPAPAFSAVNSEGKTVNLNDYRGKTIVLEWTNDGCPTGAAEEMDRSGHRLAVGHLIAAGCAGLCGWHPG
jgi:hypothetical protein